MPRTEKRGLQAFVQETLARYAKRRSRRRNRRRDRFTAMLERLEERTLLTSFNISQLTNTTGAVISEYETPSVSADGHRVVFSSTGDLTGENPDAGSEVFLWESSTNEIRQLTDGLFDPELNERQPHHTSFNPSISADGTRVAFVSSSRDFVGDPGEERLANYDSVQVLNLTTNHPTEVFVGSIEDLSINADGTRVAIAGREHDYSFPGQIRTEPGLFIADTASASPTNVLPGSFPSALAISGDGTRVAYRAGSFNPQIFRLNTTTDEVTQITNTSFEPIPGAPAISIDGTRIIVPMRDKPTYVDETGTTLDSREVVQFEAGAMTVLTQTADFFIGDISPDAPSHVSSNADGTKIVFVDRYTRSVYSKQYGDLTFLDSSAASGAIGATSFRTQGDLSGRFRNASIGADGQTIAFTAISNLGANSDHNLEVFLAKGVRDVDIKEFEGLDASSRVRLSYYVNVDTTDPVTIDFYTSKDDRYDLDQVDSDDSFVESLTISPTSIANSGGAMRLLGGAGPEDAVKAGEHVLEFDASLVPGLVSALEDDTALQVFATSDPFAGIIDPASAVISYRGSSAPFRGFFRGDSSDRLVARTGTSSRGATIDPGDAGNLDLSVEFDTLENRMVVATTRSTTVDVSLNPPVKLLVVTSDRNDFIRVAPGVTLDTIVRAGDGTNLVVGGAGNDDIEGGDGVDVLLGEGFGLEASVLEDFLTKLSKAATEPVQLAAITLQAQGAGEDRLKGGAGFDVLMGGPGADTLISGDGGGLLLGDSLRAEVAFDANLVPLFSARDFSDAKDALVDALGFSAAVTLDGGGRDTIYGGSGLELVLGGGGNDTFEAIAPGEIPAIGAGGLIDVIFGNDGDDNINDRSARYTIAFGGAGDDVLIGGHRGSFLVGNGDNDALVGGNGVDVLIGDTLDFDGHANLSKGLQGFADGDFGIGFEIKPTDVEHAGSDVLMGGFGFDVLVGGSGDDFLEGGYGAGLLFGDSFNLSTSLGVSLADVKQEGTEEATRQKTGGLFSKALSLLAADASFELQGEGDDHITGGSGVDLAFGGVGDDQMFTGGGLVDLFFGNEDSDAIRGGGVTTLLITPSNIIDPELLLVRELAQRRRAGENLPHSFLDDSNFSVMVGGTGNDSLSATPPEDGDDASIWGSVLIGDAFRFLDFPTNPADIFKIEFNGVLPTKFGIQAGFVQEGAGNDELVGAAGGFNLLIGGNGDDQLTGQGFFDVLLGDSVNVGIDVSVTLDYSSVSLGNSTDENLDAVDTSFELPGLAGDGADTIQAGDGFTVAIGGAGSDTIRDDGGTVNLLFGNDGNDTIAARHGFNVMVGGDGNDNLVGGDGSNVILGDSYSFATPGSLALAAIKDNNLRTGVGFVSSGNGRDTIVGGKGFDFIIAGDGRDTVDAGDGTNIVFGDAIDLAIGKNLNFRQHFVEAVKAVVFGNRNDLLDLVTDVLGFTGDGPDILTGGGDTDIIFGGGGNDVIDGGGNGLTKFDFLVGGRGDDVVRGGPGDDVVLGGLGDDELRGGTGDDVLESEGGVDRFFGETGNDQIFGGAENDFLFGGAGDDQLFGEEGDDLLDGGTGNNLFLDDQGTNTILTTRDPLEGFHTIADGIGGLPVGTLEEFSGFGNSMAGIGDVDGNGVPDIAVGTYEAVYILLLAADGTVLNYTKIADGEGGLPDEVLNERIDKFGSPVRDAFGQAVAGLGDLNQDGIPDLAVGAPALAEELIPGSVHILFLNPDGTVRDHARLSDGVGGLPAGTIESDFRFGTALATLPDLNGDGINDLAVGTLPNGPNQHVHVLLMNDDGTVKASNRIADGAGGLPAGSLTELDSFGVSLASFGDLDGDGISDLAVGAPGETNAGGSYAGAVHLLRLNPDGTVNANTKIAEGSAGLPSGTVQRFNGFGRAISALGDQDGERSMELAVTSQRDGQGIVHILSLNADGTVKSNYEVGGGSSETPDGLASKLFGLSVAFLGDVNDDGSTDLAIVGGDHDFVPDQIDIVFQQPQAGYEATVTLQDGQSSLEILSEESHLVTKLTSGAELMRLERPSLRLLRIIGTPSHDLVTVSESGDLLTNPILVNTGEGHDQLGLSLEDVESALVVLGVDLGAGNDTLRLTGSEQILDLSDVADANLQGVETIDITGSGDNSLTLNLDEVLNISSTTDTLRVQYDDGDVVNFDNGWTAEMPQIVGGQYLHVLTQNSATVEVDNLVPYQNPLRRLDTDRDGIVAPLDALIIINRLNASGPQTLQMPTAVAALNAFYYIDVNGDGSVAPIDVLQVVNFLNNPTNNLEGEFAFPTGVPRVVDSGGSVSVLDALNEDQNGPTRSISATIIVSPISASEDSRCNMLDHSKLLGSGPLDQDLAAAIDAFFDGFDLLTL